MRMYVFSGPYVAVDIPADVVAFPADKEEIREKVIELNALIHSIMTGEPLPWR